ncbi:DNA mismatch repair protein MutS [Halogranum amylolyticum]|uniref:DNA mismatch repair protein MutS n=1 Tax=Halogranum amylolyticum TaxID=660520 RepID=A0A1H8TT12_9EURY|nr:DNA mismatch repair protein MutS [Halogranum amylolyticum]SEO93568.1 DNA mismatch repair protein MutS [Halogranum amylolyticum]
MTSVTGPPEKMVAVREDLTPMMSQYLALCEEYEASLVLFQVGDFYEAFCDAAAAVARICEVTLTKREDSTGTYPMAGIPIDNAASYVERLLDAGYRVAVADQVEDAEEASGLVDRAVTRIVTPGTVVDEELLSAGTTNYVAALAREDDVFSLAAVDVSTGECLVTSADRERIVEELERVAPAELLFGSDVDADAFDPDVVAAEAMVTDFDADAFDPDSARDTLAGYVPSPEAVVANDAELRACGGLLAYAEYTQGDERLDYVSRVTRYDPRESLRLDATALRSLELFETRGASSGHALVDVLDDTACALGRRELTQWLRRPLVDRERIAARHDAVAEFVETPLVREAVHERLKDVYDVERLVARVSRGRANARDLRSLKTTLDVVPELRAELRDVDAERLRELRDALDELADVRELIDRAVAEDPPVEITEGGVVREGFDDELDDLRRTEREGREWVADLEASERERTGIDSLDVGYNQVHGYYIEVTNPNLDRVPDDYQRRQTLKNSERFYTPELKRREDEILGAAERADKLEYELFTDVRSDVAAEADRVQAVAAALSELDVLATLAAVAVDNDYVRPTFHTDGERGIHVEGGRHPVVERTRSEFVPNDTRLGGDEGNVAVVTGPNMSGKSTYMRQVALIVVLAQTGSFVPADAARLPVVDRVFTRVGASDDIAGGQSTFMREMAELTDILHGATEHSLVLLDEVGRGTSTADGRAIARATTEFVDDEVGAYTLFATHYHELTAVADEREDVFNLHFTAESDGDDVTFLHRVEPGASSSSYGVEVARMAGVPDRVVARSQELVESEAGGSDANGRSDAEDRNDVDDAPGDEEGSPDETRKSPRPQPRSNGHGEVGAQEAGRQTTLTNGVGGGDGAETPRHGREAALEAVAAELDAVDVAQTTPLEALTTLNDLKNLLDDS